MSGVEVLARVLSAANWGDRKTLAEFDAENWQGHARAILADPGPLLEALAEAGVLRQSERLATRMVYDADGGPTDRVIITERRYVTEWRPTARA